MLTGIASFYYSFIKYFFDESLYCMTRLSIWDLQCSYSHSSGKGRPQSR